MARRRNAIFHRFSRMRGLPPEEKMLMQRIGNMLDAALNNRQASNPFEPSKNKFDRVLYPPTGLIAFTGFRTLKLVWQAANSDQHLYYEIFVINLDTGKEETHKSFTNEFRFKGLNGNYTAAVRSVGRDGKTSPWHEAITFTLGGSEMQIEGSKNGPTTLGTMVQDDITIYDDYSIYAWGSEVLDKYAAGASNEPSVFRLWTMIGANQVFDSSVATLQETVVQYPATESVSNLSPIARGGTIVRPVATRPGSFETSLSTMFSPIKVDTSEGSVVVTFFLEALNRTIELDEVNLSLVLWGGFDGLGDSVPGDPWDGGRSGYVFPHLNSLRLWREEVTTATGVVTKGRYYMAKQPKSSNIIDNAWTVAVWFRHATQHVDEMYDDTSEENKFTSQDLIILKRSSFNAAGNYAKNSILIRNVAVFVSGNPPGSRYKMYTEVTVFDANGTTSVLFDVHNNTFSEPPNADNSMLWGHQPDFDANNYGWQFMVICFEGGPAGTFPGSTPKIRVYANRRLGDPSNPDDRDSSSPNKMESINQRVAQGAVNTVQISPTALVETAIEQDITDDYIYTIGCNPNSFFTGGKYDGDDISTSNSTFTIHQMGMWNVAIDNWDGMGFNPGIAELRDSSPWYLVPYDDSSGAALFNPNAEDGRQSLISGTSMPAIHYLFNQGYGTDIDWKKNSNERSDGAREYIFAENLVHLWQFGAVPDGTPGGGFTIGDETLRDTGNWIYGGNVDFLSSMAPGNTGVTNLNGWDDDAKLADIFAPVRWPWAQPNTDNSGMLPGPWDPGDGSPTWTTQAGIVYGADSDGPEGTTSHYLTYPGQGLRHREARSGNSMDWRRPNTGNTGSSGVESVRTGVLNEPKSWDPKFFFGSVFASQEHYGFEDWDP